MASKKLSTTAGRFDVQMAQCVVINQIDKEILNYRVFPADTPDDFPSVGDVGCIYKAAKEAKLYQWNEDLQKYQPLNESIISIDELQNVVTDLQSDVVDLRAYVDKHYAETDIMAADITLLQQLVGDKSVSEQITEAISGSFTDTLLNKLDSIEPNAQVNRVEKIDIAGTVVDAVNKIITIPVASQDSAGVVKSSAGANKVNVSSNGEMSVNKISVNSIFVPIGDELVLGGGDASEQAVAYPIRVGNIGYDNIADAINCADNGDVIVLQEDIDLTSNADDHLVINAENITIDLDDKTFIANGSMGAVKVESGITTFDGVGIISGTLGADDYSMAVWATGGKVVINDGIYRNETDGTERGTDLIYASGDACIEINGGTFEAAKPEWTLNCRDADYKAGKAKIVVKGGRFYKFDPADCNCEGKHTNFVADGYKSTKDDDYYIVTSA